MFNINGDFGHELLVKLYVCGQYKRHNFKEAERHSATNKKLGNKKFLKKTGYNDDKYKKFSGNIIGKHF